MNKKIMIISILAVFMLFAIMFASTVTSNTQKPPKKESPLFGIRTRWAIREKMGDFIRRFVGERVFFLPFQLVKKVITNIIGYYNTCTDCSEFTCEHTHCNDPPVHCSYLCTRLVKTCLDVR
jgi:hypothetical protein